MIRVDDIIAAQNSRHIQCLCGTKGFKGEMATRENKDRVEAMKHLNLAIDRLKIAVKNGDEKSEKILGKLWFHRIIKKGGVSC